MYFGIYNICKKKYLATIAQKMREEEMEVFCCKVLTLYVKGIYYFLKIECIKLKAYTLKSHQKISPKPGLNSQETNSRDLKRRREKNKMEKRTDGIIRKQTVKWQT